MVMLVAVPPGVGHYAILPPCALGTVTPRSGVQQSTLHTSSNVYAMVLFHGAFSALTMWLETA